MAAATAASPGAGADGVAVASGGDARAAAAAARSMTVISLVCNNGSAGYHSCQQDKYRQLLLE